MEIIFCHECKRATTILQIELTRRRNDGRSCPDCGAADILTHGRWELDLDLCDVVAYPLKDRSGWYRVSTHGGEHPVDVEMPSALGQWSPKYGLRQVLQHGLYMINQERRAAFLTQWRRRHEVLQPQAGVAAPAVYTTDQPRTSFFDRNGA